MYIELGECWCGCDEEVPKAATTVFSKFQIKDMPYKFVAGHDQRVPRADPNIVGVCPVCHIEKPKDHFMRWRIACWQCQVEHRKQLAIEFQRTRLRKPVVPCACGCGWYVSGNSAHSVIPSHNNEIYLPADSPILFIDRGYISPCMEREVKESVSIKRILLINPNGTSEWSEVRAWENSYGSLPRGAKIHHICGSLKCENPEHMSLDAPKYKAPKPRPEGIEEGYCWCGCGRETPIAAKSRSRSNTKRGEHIHYLPGHNGSGY